jgi:hypothetical protein
MKMTRRKPLSAADLALVTAPPLITPRQNQLYNTKAFKKTLQSVEPLQKSSRSFKNTHY